MQNVTQDGKPEDVAVIYSYTRQQAIADGELVDVTDRSKARGILYPVAFTRAVWVQVVMAFVDREKEREDGATVHANIDAALDDLRAAIRAERQSTDEVVFACSRGDLRFDLWARCHGDDTRMPCITVMMVGD